MPDLQPRTVQQVNTFSIWDREDWDDMIRSDEDDLEELYCNRFNDGMGGD